MRETRPENGGIYRHFKGNLYRVETIATHTETGEELVIYQALYGDFAMYARPLSMFMSEVDRRKYPDAVQRYRFERADLKPETGERKPGTVNRLPEAAERETEMTEQKPPAAEAATDGTETVHPKLMEFLDAERMEDKYNILVSMRDCVTDAMINTMAVVLDVVIPDGELAERYDQLKICIRTKMRYEIERP